MKKIIFMITTILLLSGCNERNLPEEGITENNIIKDFNLYIIPTVNCNNKVTEYLTIENRKVYLICLDEIYLKREDTKDMTLKYHLQNVYQEFDDSIKEIVSDVDDIYYIKDGGTKIYKHNEYTVIVCNTTTGNKDVYFGNANLDWQQEYCK